MSTQMTTQETFQDKVKDRLREQIGDLMPEDLLTEIVDKSIRDIFFKRKEKKNSWEPEPPPSWIHEVVKELLEPAVKAAVDRWVKDNEVQLLAVVQQSIDRGAAGAFVKGIDRIFADRMLALQGDIQNHIQSLL